MLFRRPEDQVVLMRISISTRERRSSTSTCQATLKREGGRLVIPAAGFLQRDGMLGERYFRGHRSKQ
jgi:hypothetical protein